MPRSLIDLAFHAVIWEPEAYRRGDLRDAAALGVGSVKLWLAYIELGIQADDDVAFEVIAGGRRAGHGRACPLRERARDRRARRGSWWSAASWGSSSLPRSRPIELEAECMHRFLVMAELAGATPYVVHVTGRAPLEEIVAAPRGAA